MDTHPHFTSFHHHHHHHHQLTQTKMSDHITPIFRDPHWLPVEMRIDCKMLSLVYSCMTGTTQQYFQELIPGYLPVHHLQSSTQSHLCIAGVDQGKNKKHFGVGAFFCAAPKLWNSLLISLREHNWKETFKKNLKTYLFSEN